MLQSKAGYIDARPLTASSAKPLATHGRTIHQGQTEKNSVRAYVFRFALELGHCSTQSACLKRANNRHWHAFPDLKRNGCETLPGHHHRMGQVSSSLARRVTRLCQAKAN